MKRKIISLTQGKIALVDTEDFDLLSKYKWHASGSRNRFYARHSKREKNHISHLKMEHMILGIPKNGYCIDHINRNSLDNRKANLRICSLEDNKRNRSLSRNNSSGFPGVSFHKHKNKWISSIVFKSKRIHLGYFNHADEASKVYEIARSKYFRFPNAACG